MGEILNLIDAWEPYKAAKSALSNSLEPQNLSEYSKKHRIKFQVGKFFLFLKKHPNLS